MKGSRKAGVKRSLLACVKKLLWLVISWDTAVWRKTSSEGFYQEVGREANQRLPWLGNITEWTNMNPETVLRTADSRTEWRTVIARAVNSRVKTDEEQWLLGLSSLGSRQMKNSDCYGCQVSDQDRWRTVIASAVNSRIKTDEEQWLLGLSTVGSRQMKNNDS